MASSEREGWLDATVSEVCSLLEKGTFEVVDIPNRPAVSTKWVFKEKEKALHPGDAGSHPAWGGRQTKEKLKGGEETNTKEKLKGGEETNTYAQETANKRGHKS